MRTHLLGGGGAGELGPIAAVRIVVADGHGDLEGVVGQQPEWAFEVDPQYGGGARGHVEALLDGSGRASEGGIVNQLPAGLQDRALLLEVFRLIGG